MKVVATNEAKTHLSSLLQEVERGETIVISRGRKPLAKLVPYTEAERAPRPKVGEMIDEPCHIPEEAFRPMNEDELRAWGGDMNVLLDTCTFLWLTREPQMISPLAREVLDDPTTTLNMSHASVLEMVVKHRAGKLTFPQPPEKWIPSRRTYFQIKDLPLDELLIYRSGKLPDVHRDPFDRLIAAHAMQAGCTVISPDTQLGLLGASRLW